MILKQLEMFAPEERRVVEGVELPMRAVLTLVPWTGWCSVETLKPWSIKGVKLYLPLGGNPKNMAKDERCKVRLP